MTTDKILWSHITIPHSYWFNLAWSQREKSRYLVEKKITIKSYRKSYHQKWERKRYVLLVNASLTPWNVSSSLSLRETKKQNRRVKSNKWNYNKRITGTSGIRKDTRRATAYNYAITVLGPAVLLCCDKIFILHGLLFRIKYISK